MLGDSLQLQCKSLVVFILDISILRLNLAEVNFALILIDLYF